MTQIDLGLDMDDANINIKRVSIMMVICIKQDLGYILSSIHEKVNQHGG